MIKSTFDSKSGILEVQYIGVITIEEVIDYIEATKNNITYPRKLKILTLATQAKMNFSPSDLSRIVNANLASLERYDMITDAIILSSPKETALSILYQELSKTNKYKFQVFSTRPAAMVWLSNS